MREFLEKHLMGIIAGAFALYGGYITGQMTMENRLTNSEKDIATIKSQLRSRSSFINESKQIIDYTCNKDPDCRIRYPPVVMPE